MDFRQWIPSFMMFINNFSSKMVDMLFFSIASLLIVAILFHYFVVSIQHFVILLFHFNIEMCGDAYLFIYW